MAGKLPPALTYVPPRPRERQAAGKDPGLKPPEPIKPPTPKPKTPPPPRPKTPPPPRPKTPPPPPKPKTPPPPTIKRPISPLPTPKHVGIRDPDPYDDDYQKRRRRRHSASDDYGDDEDDDEDLRHRRGIRVLYPPPSDYDPDDRYRKLNAKTPGRKKMSKSKPNTPTPPRTSKSRAGLYGLHPKPYGFEDPVILDPNTYYKARLVTFYRNGDPFHLGNKVSFRPGRDFVSMESLCNYLTTRMDLPSGVRYIFTVEGKRVRRLDEFESGSSYVCSSRKKFEPLNYGDKQKNWVPHLKFDPSSEMKPFRVPSPPVRRMNGLRGSSDGSHNGSGPTPGSREGRVIKVINNQNHKIQSRILLNLKTAQPWEEVLEDLGQALKMKGAKKLYTISGQEVKSFSQLRNDFQDVETFYLDTGEAHSLRRRHDSRKESSRSLEEQNGGPRDRDKRGKRPGSAPPVPGDRGRHNSDKAIAAAHEYLVSSMTPVRVLINGARRDLYPPSLRHLRGDNSAPDKSLVLDWLYGYRGYDTRHNLVVLPSGELLYYVATVAILYDKFKHKQRHYIGHTEDITCLSLTYNKEICATGQREGKGKYGLAHVRIWDVQTLETLSIIGVNEVDNGIAAVSFSKQNKGAYLMVVDESSDHVMTLWDWRNHRVIAKTATYTREVHGGAFYPFDDNLVITFGKSHLTTWRRRPTGLFEKTELVKAVGDNIMCIEFDDSGDLVAGDSTGAISVWTDDGEGSFKLYKEYQAHQKAVHSLLCLPDGTLLSGGNDRYIKAWRSAKSYKLIATTMLPDTAGGVRTLCPHRHGAEEALVYVGTTRNMILEGSLYRRFAILVQGHYKHLTALAVDPDNAAFVTAGSDRSICRWSMHRLKWRVQIESECTSLAYHPSDLIVVVGTQDGYFLALNADSGMHIATVSVSKDPVTCLVFAEDGYLLAAGSKDGNLYLFTVSNNGFAYKKGHVLRGSDTILHMDFSKDGSCIQSDTEDYDLLYWDIVNLEQERIPATMRDVSWARMSCTLGYSIHGIWNNINQKIQGLITSCHVSSSEKLLAAADDEGYVRLFRYPCISPKADYQEIKAYTGPVASVQFLYDDSFLISAGGSDAAIMQWMVVNDR